MTDTSARDCGQDAGDQDGDARRSDHDDHRIARHRPATERRLRRGCLAGSYCPELDSSVDSSVVVSSSPAAAGAAPGAGRGDWGRGTNTRGRAADAVATGRSDTLTVMLSEEPAAEGPPAATGTACGFAPAADGPRAADVVFVVVAGRAGDATVSGRSFDERAKRMAMPSPARMRMPTTTKASAPEPLRGAGSEGTRSSRLLTAAGADDEGGAGGIGTAGLETGGMGTGGMGLDDGAGVHCS